MKPVQYEALNRNNDFRRIYARGKVQAGPLLVTYVCKNRVRRPRIGITVSKKVGKAVRRNRARRVIREADRLLGEPVEQNVDVIFVARGKTPYVKSTDLLPVMKRQLKVLGVIQ